MSVQASNMHYCIPKKSFNDYYEAVQISFISKSERLLKGYAQNDDIPSNTVYGFVPVSLCDEIIKKHGGFDHWKEEFD